MRFPMQRPLRAGDDFWHVIERCLIEFHSWEPDSARKRVEQFRSAIAEIRRDDEDDLILHAEPFEIAGDMAGRDLDLAEHRERYEAIVDACQREIVAAQAHELAGRAEARPAS